MQARLLILGFRASEGSCREWIRKYKSTTNMRDGNVSLLRLSRQDLQRWYYVDGLCGIALQKKFADETGITYGHSNLVRWLKSPAQLLPHFNHNEEIHGHACGEFVLDQLQRGVSAELVKQQLLEQYLVHATTQRVLAYRTYREQTGNYWTLKTLEPLHWKFLYGSVSLEQRIANSWHRSSHTRPAIVQRILGIRSNLCQKEGIAEDSQLGISWEPRKLKDPLQV